MQLFSQQVLATLERGLAIDINALNAEFLSPFNGRYHNAPNPGSLDGVRYDLKPTSDNLPVVRTFLQLRSSSEVAQLQPNLRVREAMIAKDQQQKEKDQVIQLDHPMPVPPCQCPLDTCVCLDWPSRCVCVLGPHRTPPVPTGPPDTWPQPTTLTPHEHRLDHPMPAPLDTWVCLDWPSRCGHTWPQPTQPWPT